jgi:hypothetical protein
MDATFGDLMIDPTEFTTTDHKTVCYTPPSTLEDKTYEFYVMVRDDQGNILESNVIYFFFSYIAAPQKTTGAPLPIFWMITGLLPISGCIIVFVLRRKKVKFDDFIYMKNKKIIPFVRPLVIGPMSIHIDDTRINKAEFYIDGALKQTITEAPFYWSWNEKSFMKHKLETKVYDAEGNLSSGGEFEFYIFNPSARLFKEESVKKP